jgi:hypothetical protein
MSKSLYIYLRQPLKDLERIVEAHQEEFDALLGDTFSDEELVKYEKLIDSISTIEVQPIIEELSFDDFYAKPSEEKLQEGFFEACRSSLCLDNLPFFETNPFQITYLKDLLWTLEDALIDRGGVQELLFKKDYLEELRKYKTIDSLVQEEPKAIKAQIVLGPVDKLVHDIYRELQRLTDPDGSPLPEKTQKLLKIMSEKDLDSSQIFKTSGLIPKDFEDHLEKLKFFLKKL